MEEVATVSRAQLKKLFQGIDKRLCHSLEIYVIGGAAAILGYNVVKETNDVDVDGKISPEFARAFELEAKAQNLNLHLSEVGVFSPPENYRERAKFEDFPERKLRVWYLDQYDLAISKIDRGIEKDFVDIERVHKRAPYDVDKLIQIFNEEYIKTVAIGDPRVKKMNLVDLAARLFGDDVAVSTASKIGIPVPK
jgi:hypothetical protein